jgi:hypothetical protein
MVEALAAGMRPFEQLDGAVHGGSFLVARDEKDDRARRIRGLAPETQRRGDHGGEAALHVAGAAPMQHAVADRPAEGVARPGARVSHRHDIGMAGDDEDRALAADPGVEILDVGRAGG